tara:strand:- start:202 stop:909 length:708 start_codon:yes stop_codon:yes gene_type:complete
MENSITKISDLPSNNPSGGSPPETISISSLKNKQMSDEQANYTPINVHPNPYGISEKNPIVENQMQPTAPENMQNMHFQETQMPRGGMPEEFRNQIETLPPQHLPSRDIPMNPNNLMIDENIKPNHIPNQTMRNDYVREQHDLTEQNLREYEQKKHRENKLDNLINQIQMPVFVALLYFLFSTPTINGLLFKNVSFLKIYNDDGNFNLNGLLFKSLLFGLVYFSVNNAIDFLTTI